MQGFLFQATIYLGAAVLAVPLAARLGLGSVLGYLAAGIIIGPATGLVGAETEDLQHFAEFGVVMMLFLIGLELEPRALWNMRQRLIGLGGVQVVLTTGALFIAGSLLGLDANVALATGLIFALSSTAIVLQTLSEKGLMQAQGGRSVFSVLLTQDIAVIPMLALLPLLAVSGHGGGSAHGAPANPDAPGVKEVEAARTLIENLPGWAVTLVTLGAVAVVVLTGIYLTRPVFRYIHHARLRELYTALGLLMVVSIAVLMELVGLSPALGTFLAGVVLANSEFRHELESDLEPFKGLLLGLFFITVGAGIDFGVLLDNPMRIAALTLAVIAIKGGVLYLLARIAQMHTRDGWLFTLALAQAGEFGFVLSSFSLQQGVLTSSEASVIRLVIGLSMLITPLLFILYEQLVKRAEKAPDPDPDEIDRQAPIIIAGIGRFGQVVSRLVQGAGFDTVVLDHDMEMIDTMRRFGFGGFFGDPTRPDILHAAGLETAKVLVVALDDRHAALKLVRHARAMRPDLHIVARAYDREHVYQLFQAGANDIVREMFDSSLRAGRYVLENIGLSQFEASELEMAFYQQDRAVVRELAQLWKPGVPVSQNPEYVKRARELNKDLETSILERLHPQGDATETEPLEGVSAVGYRSKDRG
ncbi:MAG: monovalent cation:proton antiporter-2 (CPA2) family protein [Limimaricola soesokkakensis]|uniref:Glutathione-regulated potassium-efflux system protein KefC n=1 Tax=Limimaricola soesokkakensis TaxID=1343159 RepID=A0A1X6Y868_9RHOB|nr:monovalent cation:proton antiporter-2 (CPA2) family protein [Limimaricola soesokkakensis]PSK87243.1 Kef-type potassium/proton antiporter (CPA2 family) [Limimaricola soesokkakensis]SLN13634.1 Glutathione-regulated potassium-efflux system protein KefC [Limimaricola soesokkakensis]